METPAELLHARLKALLLFLKPFLLGGDVDQDRLAQLRRLSDVRIRQAAVSKPQMTGTDLCALLADPRVGRFDDLADETGVLRKSQMSVVLPLLAEDMGYLIEACLTHQVIGSEAMQSHAKAFVAKHGAAASPAGVSAPATAAARPAAAPVAPGVARLLAPMKELWSLAPSTLKALALLAAADSPADAVCAEVERDPALSARTIRFMNASTPTRASSVKRAVVAHGYPLTRRFVMTAALSLKLGPPHGESGFDERAFWIRAFTAAHAAFRVCRATKLGNPDEHFSAGLLHGIGRLAAAKAGGLPADAPAGDVGAAILERWRFPAAVVDAARRHAVPAELLEELQMPREAMVVAALHGLLEKRPGAWAGFLRVAADALPSILDDASKAAQDSAAELLG